MYLKGGFFMSMFVNAAEDGSYSLNSTGIAAVIVLIVLLLVITGFFKDHDKKVAEKAYEKGRKSVFSVRQLTFSAIGTALAFVLSYVKIFHMPWGGSVTLCSMLFVALIGNWYGLKIGLISGFVYGCLQFLQGGGSYILDPLQAGLDYFFAFTALGLSGAFKNLKKGSLAVGYTVAIIVRGALHSIGGYLYWMDYMPDNFPSSLASVYPILYNYAYILAEGVITLIVISLPPVRKALIKIKELATQ